MVAFLDLLSQNMINPLNLITHRFPFDESIEVFNKIANGELGGYVAQFAAKSKWITPTAGRAAATALNTSLFGLSIAPPPVDQSFKGQDKP